MAQFGCFARQRTCETFTLSVDPENEHQVAFQKTHPLILLLTNQISTTGDGMSLKQILTFYILIVTTTTVFGGESESGTSVGRKNIVMFLIDDLGWSDLGC